MAVAIEYVNVIARKSAVEEKYPGGLDGFVRQALPNYIEDEDILRVGFMSTGDACRFIDELSSAGLGDSDSLSGPAVIAWGDAVIPPWLTVGDCEGRAACWLRDRPPGPLVDLDPVMMLRCRAFATVEQLANALRCSGVEARERATQRGADAMLLDCERGDTRIEVEVFMEPADGRPFGIWGRRDLTRRTLIVADVALMRDLIAALERAEA